MFFCDIFKSSKEASEGILPIPLKILYHVKMSWK